MASKATRARKANVNDQLVTSTRIDGAIGSVTPEPLNSVHNDGIPIQGVQEDTPGDLQQNTSPEALLQNLIDMVQQSNTLLQDHGLHMTAIEKAQGDKLPSRS